MRVARVSFVISATLCVAAVARAEAAGLQADLRGSATAPAGAAVIAAQTWVCDASQGFTPLLAGGVSTAGIHLPMSPTTVPATCGEIASDGNGNVYVTQGVVDTTVTPSPARGILRVVVDPATGAVIGAPIYIATTAGLGGDQPTAAAIGPDGNLYVAFLKNGNIKRIVNPASGTTQAVQSVGVTPNGHPARALAFAGTDLYIGSADAFSVIRNATSPSCTGGCNAAAIADGFSGVPHVGVTSNGIDTVYVAVGTFGQVWRYTPATGLFAFIASGFSFVSAKSNLLTLDAAGTLWIGDDPSNGATAGAGRIWTVSAAALSTVTGGNVIAGTNLQLVLNALRGPWLTQIGNTSLVVTFKTDGTFTATITLPGGTVTTDSGTWTLTPPVTLAPFGNPQGQLTLVDTQGAVLLAGDALLANVDLIALEPAISSLTDAPSIGLLQLVKFAA